LNIHLQPETRPAQRWLPWPKRFDIALLSFFALVIALCDRVNMAVAAPMIMQEYRWDTVKMGWVLSGFFIGYTLFMVPIGMLVDRYGPKRVFAWSVGWWSLFTALTPLPKSLSGMTLMRIIMGGGESAMIPSVNGILVRWFPRQEYSRATGFSWSGGYAGAIIAFPLASSILSLWGWRAVFFAFAFLGAIWLPLWLLSSSDDPAESHSVTQAELEYIVGSRPEMEVVRMVPWRKILRLPALWAAMSLHFSANWFSYILISWLPTYLMAERHFSLTSMAIGSSLPFLSALIGTNLFGALIDRFSIGRDRTRVRKVFLLPYAMAAGAFLLVPSTTSPFITVLLLCLSMALMSSAQPVYASGSLDLAPRYAGTAVAIQNCMANFAGILVPVVTGYLVKSTGWGAAFWLTALISGTGILIYLAFGQAKKLID
jgi:MFS family permease